MLSIDGAPAPVAGMTDEALKLIDTAGRVDKFRRKYASVAEKKAAK